MSTHFVEKCKSCGIVISQCRCPGPKLVKHGLCDACKKSRDALDAAVEALMVGVFK